MNQSTRRFSPALALTLSLVALPSCALLGESKQGPADVDELVGWVERVYVDAELAREEIAAAMLHLQAIAAATYRSTPVAAYDSFSDAVERSKKQEGALHAAVAPMKSAGPRLFEKWSEDLGAFHSPSMRRRSQDRLDAARQSFDAVIRAIEPAQSTLTKFNQGLHDHQLFLGNDFNSASVTTIREDVKMLAVLRKDLDAQLDRCLKAAKMYIDLAALPSSTEAAQPAK